MIASPHKPLITESHPKWNESLLLAPRGVYQHGSTLAISDTGQNRVFLHDTQHAEKTIVLGQTSVTNTDRNSGAAVHASSLQYPSGIWTDGIRLIVADAWNHRVLIWHQLPSQNGQAADTVIGQKNFSSNEPNMEGIGQAPSADSLYWPYGVFSDGKSLWIADTGNRRILFFKTIPFTNGVKADAVIGQPDFASRDYDHQHAVWPYSVKISSNGSMLIADTQYYRVLYWDKWTDALKQSPDLLFGQPDMNSNGQNRFQLKPSANTLNWCYDACFIPGGIAIADTGNSRILIWDKIPAFNGAPADRLYGQAHFEVVGESSLSMKSTVANDMYWPFAVNYIQDQLVIADTGNHRLSYRSI